MKKLTALIALAGIAAVLCTNAQAANMAGAPTVTLHYAAVDAADAASAGLLYRRINAAAERVCGGRIAPGTPFLARGWKRCVQVATRDALAQVNTASLMAYAAGHGTAAPDAVITSHN